MAIWPQQDDGGAGRTKQPTPPSRHHSAKDRAEESLPSVDYDSFAKKLDPEMLPRPPHQEVVFAAQAILNDKIEQCRKMGETPPDPRRYRGKLVSELKKKENWWQVYTANGYDLGDPPLPEVKTKKPICERTPRDGGKFLLKSSNGSEEWVSEATYKNVMFDYEGDPSDECRLVREPLDWLMLKHPGAYKNMLELVETTRLTVEQLLTESYLNNRSRYSKMLGAYDEESDTYADPRGWEQKDLYMLHRNEAFRSLVCEYYSAKKAKA